MNMSGDSNSEAEHTLRMQSLQVEMRAKITGASEQRDLLIVHTGDGKGKSTAAFGMLARMLGHGRRCAVVQFIKAGDATTEHLLRGPLLGWHGCGDGFTWDTQNRAADIARCREGWSIACDYLRDSEVKFLLLDELNIALAYDYLPVSEVLDAVLKRAPGKHVVITGRGALPALIGAADLVTEMREIKHPFQSGVKAQAGIEF